MVLSSFLVLGLHSLQILLKFLSGQGLFILDLELSGDAVELNSLER